jgi:glycogen synthase
MGVPSVTSNLTGFSTFISKLVHDPAAEGIFVVDRRYCTYSESVKQMTEIMKGFTALSRRERIEVWQVLYAPVGCCLVLIVRLQLRNRTEKLSDSLDWRHLEKHYTEAHKLAYQRTFGEELDLSSS